MAKAFRNPKTPDRCGFAGANKDRPRPLLAIICSSSALRPALPLTFVGGAVVLFKRINRLAINFADKSSFGANHPIRC